MEQVLPSISAADLYDRLGTASAPMVVDVRRPADFASADALIVSAFHRDPDQVRTVATTSCPAGGASSFTAFMAIRSAKASRLRCAPRASMQVYLQDGIAGWIDNGLPDLPAGQHDAGQMGDARASEDRPHRLSMADPPLHRSAGGVHLRPGQGRARRSPKKRVERPTTSTGVEFTHEGERCSFDTILRIYGIKDPALDHLADDRPRRRHVAPRSGPAVRRPVRHLARPVRQLPGRPRDARARHGDVRRAL